MDQKLFFQVRLYNISANHIAQFAKSIKNNINQVLQHRLPLTKLLFLNVLIRFSPIVFALSIFFEEIDYSQFSKIYQKICSMFMPCLADPSMQRIYPIVGWSLNTSFFTLSSQPLSEVRSFLFPKIIAKVLSSFEISLQVLIHSTRFVKVLWSISLTSYLRYRIQTHKQMLPLSNL